MVMIKPLRGLRPKAELAPVVSCPPYDVLSSEEAREMASGNQLSFLHISKPEIDLPPDTDPYSDIVYETGKNNLNRFIRDGILIQDARESIYIYKLTWRGHQQIGYYCLSSVDDYLANRIKKHEFTRPQKEADRTRLIDTLNAQVGPVFLLYKSDPILDGLLERYSQARPEVDFVAPDNVRHQLWQVDNPEAVAAIVDGFRQLEATYVADGHHRSAAASNVCRQRRERNPQHTGREAYNFFLAAIFPDNQLKILPYNRVVKDLNGLDQETFLRRVREKFDCTKIDHEPEIEDEHNFGMYLNHTWYLLTPRTGSYNAGDLLEGLDVNILMHNLLEPILGIGNPRTDTRIDFVGGIRGNAELMKLVDSGKHAVAFALCPTSVHTLIRVADAGQVMPPKSTWFEPKLRSGLMSHLLE